MTSTEQAASQWDVDAWMPTYRPEAVDAELWQQIAPDAFVVARDAGAIRFERVRLDLRVISKFAAYLAKRGRPVTLDEMFSDRTMADFDAHVKHQVSTGHHHQVRSSLLRLHRAYKNGPPPTARRSYAQRVADMKSHSLVDRLADVYEAALESDDPGAADLVAAVDHWRDARRGVVDPTHMDFSYPAAWAFAAQHGLELTAPILKATLAHEVVALAVPYAVLVPRLGLTEPEQELANTVAIVLPDSPSDEHAALLRGPAPA